ncbi:MAG: hypothetical protein A2033_14710 [Bacteroidetes bacterium GWA2_31_9]|nr:MAG: hypothetical protein A2033_14710 [Bacteroidetes bacterium GWA2_31_9]
MKKLLTINLAAILLLFSSSIYADEGMWLPLLIGKNYAEMQKLGLKLTPEQLYDINHASLKDAIVMLDHGSCTGEMISSEGLMLTNHHCGYGEIQQHSTVEHNYLEDGFWAYSKEEELSNPDKSVSFLVRIDDVTSQVLADVTDVMTESERNSKISSAIKKIEKEAIKGTDYEAKVKNMFNGNEYYMYVYETFLDVRLVGAPPSSIGKFGGDTGNWVWPRHTGDFSIFRVYTGPDGKPAKYSKDNIPYKPKHSLPVSLKGVNINDYAMIWGNPGTTERYLTSHGIKLKVDQVNPAVVKLRAMKMAIMKQDMDANPNVKIQYAAKYAFLGNFWKKDLEMIKALKKLNVEQQKRDVENQFVAWANADETRKAKYGNVIPDFEESYKIMTEKKYDLAFWYFIEMSFMNGSEILSHALQSQAIKSILDKKDLTEADKAPFIESAEKFYKDFNPETDKKLLAAMLEVYYKDVPTEFHPELLTNIQKKYKGDYTKFAQMVFDKSIYASKDKFMAFLNKPTSKAYDNDPALTTVSAFYKEFFDLQLLKSDMDNKLGKAKRLLIAGIREMNPDKLYYPDANSTMRCTYGSVLPYSPADAIDYNYITYLDGVMEKEDTTNEEFIVPKKLKELYKNKDYGQYGVNGKMPVAFLTNNDITGGNSGSPVINANGEIIGTAFDGNSEAMSSDIQFDDKLQRTIICDIRYVLFVIDKYAGATNLINEMNIVK